MSGAKLCFQRSAIKIEIVVFWRFETCDFDLRFEIKIISSKDWDFRQVIRFEICL